MESLVRILDALKDYEVQCFFSYETGDKTTFNVMATEGIEKYETKCTQLIGKPFSEYAIPCIPNFTVIPKDKSGVILDNKMYITEQNLSLIHIWISRTGMDELLFSFMWDSGFNLVMDKSRICLSDLSYNRCGVGCGDGDISICSPGG